MADDAVIAVYNSSAIAGMKKTPFSIKVGHAQVLQGGIVFNVINTEQAKIAEEAGACAVIVSERNQCGITRMTDPSIIKQIKQSVSIPVMAKTRIGHFVESQILESIGVNYIDESEELAPADDQYYINKHNFRVPFVCGCRNLGEALSRIREGAAVIRIESNSGSGNIVNAVKQVRLVMGDIRVLSNMDDDEVFTFAKRISAPYDLVAQAKQMGRLPVAFFGAGGITTPADAALMMQLGCDGVFVGSEIFDGGDSYRQVRAMVRAVTHYNDAHVLAEACCGTGGRSFSEDSVEHFV